MIRIAVAGAGGRMGQSLLSVLAEGTQPQLMLTHAVDRAGTAAIGQTVADGVTISADPADRDFDVWIDFTRPEGTLEALRYCLAHNRAMVIGTTGLHDEQKKIIATAAKQIPIVFSANMSIGVNTLWALLSVAAQAIGESSDIEIIEAHHRYKVDAPSGTALTCGEVIASALGKQLADCQTQHTDNSGARRTGDIGFANIRGGDIVGEHTALFAMDGEQLSITHRATDRRIFARGALRAAAFIGTAPAGRLYGMSDVLSLS